MAERYDIKPIPLAAAINAYNEDVGRISATNCDLLMDRHVIIDQRKKYRSENKPDRSNFSGLYFDGKKDKTIQKRGPYKCEEHITIISEPGSHYITHTRPGRLGYARWLTSANRILRIYVSQIVPSANLVLLTRFVINVYARSWFDIKYKSSFTDSPKHIFNMISRISEFDNALVTQICHRVISTNSYSLHSENILCTMLEDSDPLVRIIAANKIISIRATHLSSSLRKFIKPKINFSASNYYQLIDPDIDWLESVLTRHLSRDYLLSLAHRPHSFMYYPCHSQSVERHIRIVSETCKFVCDPDERDSRIAITIAERNVMPNFRSKQDYPI